MVLGERGVIIRLLAAMLVGAICAAIAIFAFFERVPSPRIVWQGQRIDDLLLHVLAFAGLAATLSLWRPYALRGVLGLAGCAGAVEAAQLAIPDRTASILDFGASLAGVGVGAIIGSIFARLMGIRHP